MFGEDACDDESIRKRAVEVISGRCGDKALDLEFVEAIVELLRFISSPNFVLSLAKATR